MKAISLFTFFLLVALSPIAAIAQSPKNITGYYINSAGGTVRGSFPQYKDWTNNPDKVVFLPSNATEPISLTTSNCSLFEVDDYDTYIAYAGKRITNPIDLNSSSDQIDSTSQFDTIQIFLRIIFNYDDFKLLMLQRKDRINIFYQKKNEQPIELVYKSYSTSADNFKSITTYKDQLEAMFWDSISEKHLAQNLNTLSYGEGSLANFMKKVYSVPTVKVKKKAMYKVSYSINIGAAVNFLSTTGKNNYQQTNIKSTSTISPVLTLGMYIPFGRNFGKLGLSPQLSLYSYKNSGSYTLSINNVTHTLGAQYKTDLLIVPKVYVTYKMIENKNFEWNAGAGIGLAIASGQTQIFSDNSIYYFADSSKGKDIYPTINFQTGFVLKKKINFLINYSLPTIATDYYNYVGKHSSLQFSIGYEFE
ncbi:MAG TPA: hypothetical protein VK559_12880 [Ferruginibacter sp.]|nr:hypothetical protein [Ferruginibacter sp.]